MFGQVDCVPRKAARVDSQVFKAQRFQVLVFGERFSVAELVVVQGGRCKPGLQQRVKLRERDVFGRQTHFVQVHLVSKEVYFDALRGVHLVDEQQKKHEHKDAQQNWFQP